ncbi:MAG TPA: hypothetical protein VOA87_05905 [Thermoanaerobaculia bacterium]|nr:hypothetical protein [Thermoanaerobaculia bacterium]
MRFFRYTAAIAGLALLMGTVGLAGEARAQPKPNVFDGGNRWFITAYDDCSPIHQQWATQGICFLPYSHCSTGIEGVWYSTTYPGWSGRYMQEGDRVLMHGNWGKFIGSDGMVIDLFAGNSPNDEGAGQWTEWFNSGSFGNTVGFLNTRLRRAGKCPIPPNVDVTKMSEAELGKLSADLSRNVKPRLRKDGKPAASPTDPQQVPLPEEQRP